MVLRCQDILLPQRLPRPILALKQHCAALEGLEAVPLADGNVDNRTTGDHVDGVGEPSLGVVEILLEMPTEADHRLGR